MAKKSNKVEEVLEEVVVTVSEEAVEQPKVDPTLSRRFPKLDTLKELSKENTQSHG